MALGKKIQTKQKPTQYYMDTTCPYFVYVHVEVTMRVAVNTININIKNAYDLLVSKCSINV